ncbi:MAG: DUF308 domain-containing protein [Clostridia bacterium]|nr:DUF308 domain-containing protein [Clostridia bacterium]
MQKDKFRRFVSKFPLFDLLTALFALLLIFAPISTITIVIRAIGVAAAAYAVWRIVLQFTLNRGEFFFPLLTASYLLLLVFGTILLINPKGALAFLSATVGLFLIVDGIIKLYRASHLYGKELIIGMILAAFTVLFGSVLLFYPAGTARISAILIGASLLTDSLSNIAIRYMPKRNERQKSREYIETDFVDKSDEL